MPERAGANGTVAESRRGRGVLALFAQGRLRFPEHWRS